MDGRVKKQSLVNGAIILGGCLIFARFLGIFFRIPIQNLIGDEGMGYFQMSYPIYFVFTAFASGIPISISKIISEYACMNNYDAVRKVVKITMVMFLSITLIISFSLLIFARPIVSGLKWHENSYYAFVATAIAPIFVVILFTLRGTFQGLRIMTPSGISQIVEQVGRVVFGVGLAYILFSKGVKYAAAGAALGTVLGALLGVIYLAYKYMKIINRFPKTNMLVDTKKIKKAILDNALPISLAAAVMTLMGLIDNLIVPRRLLSAGFTKMQSTILFGQTYGKAAILNNVPLALCAAICANIVPAIAEEKYKNIKGVYNKINIALKLSNVIAIPSALGLFFMAYPIMDIIFLGNSEGYEILKYFAVSLPFVVMYHSTTSILQALEKFRTPIVSIIIAVIIKFIFTYILSGIPEINITGAVIATGLGYLVACVINTIVMIRSLEMKLDIYELLFKPMIASMIMIISVVFTYRYIYNYTMRNSIATVVSIIIGIVIYCIFVLILKIFTYDEVKNRISAKR